MIMIYNGKKLTSKTELGFGLHIEVVTVSGLYEGVRRGEGWSELVSQYRYYMWRRGKTSVQTCSNLFFEKLTKKP